MVGVPAKGSEATSQLGGLLALALYLASAVLLIVSSSLTIASLDTSLGITGAVSGAFIVVHLRLTLFNSCCSLLIVLNRRAVW